VVADKLEAHGFKVCPILLAPYEVLLKVLEYLEPYDLCAVAQSCSVCPA
jgi:hypothetical protein